MELLLFVAALGVLGLVALRFGHDSRERAYSKEEEISPAFTASADRSVGEALLRISVREARAPRLHALLRRAVGTWVRP